MASIISDLLRKSDILADSILGEIIKAYIRLFAKDIRPGINTSVEREERIIISLTSYGRRVGTVLPFAVRSLLCQTVKPDMVILWLDRDNWGENNIPGSLERLRKAGLTIRFCEDLRSYKKHVPALEQYPDDIIITVDDDFYYSHDFVERLIKSYKSAPGHIHTHRAHRPLLTADGRLRPYNDWNMLIHGTDKSPVFATTGGGCLMKRAMLHDDAIRHELFRQLCPMADDVWFYFMAVLKKTPTTVLKKKPYTMIPLDNFYQLTHKGANLSCVNCKESYNDIQIKNVMSHYGISPEDLTQL